ncbi:MAG: RluA family pseudouridine synthase [Acidobacteria bacterium]|nr:MAG: RluA family pseudouridine synthase [Acidobacteriota bacterium]
MTSPTILYSMRRIVSAPTVLLSELQALYPDSSKTTLRQLLQGGRVRVNGEIEKDAKRQLERDDFIDVVARSEDRTLPPGLSILHEDTDVIVVLKANGLLTVATERERENTAQAYLTAYLGARREERIHVKNFHARERLKEQFAAHMVDRLYVAVIEGAIQPAAGTIRSHLLERKDLRMQSVEAHPDAKLAITHYRTIANAGPYSVLEVTLETGRKNQIRAHLSEAGHPVVGDQMYGSTTNPLDRLGLHAKLLGFVHPTTGRKMIFTAPLPKSFRDLMRLAQM